MPCGAVAAMTQVSVEVERGLRAGKQLLSLCCGAGGLDLGFERAGHEIGVAVDINPSSVTTYNHNRHSGRGHVADMRQLGTAELDRLAGERFSPVGIIGGPPCQSFSIATRSSDDDHRHKLPLEFARILGELNQRTPVCFFVFENVPGLAERRHAARYKAIIEAFEDKGFRVSCAVVNASWFGVAQNRRRLILVGYNRSLYPGLAWRPPEVETKQPVPIKSLLRDLPDPAFWKRNLDRSKLKPHPNHWCMTPKSRKFKTPGALVPGTSRGRSFRTLDWNQPSRTVAYGNREVHVHPAGNRRLSVYEAMLLQGFPDWYELCGTLSDQISQVSEAVPPPMAYAVACSVQDDLCRYASEALKAS